jgi:hypothetical protein
MLTYWPGHPGELAQGVNRPGVDLLQQDDVGPGVELGQELALASGGLADAICDVPADQPQVLAVDGVRLPSILGASLDPTSTSPTRTEAVSLHRLHPSHTTGNAHRLPAGRVGLRPRRARVMPSFEVSSNSWSDWCGGVLFL